MRAINYFRISPVEPNRGGATTEVIIQIRLQQLELDLDLSRRERTTYLVLVLSR